MGLMAVYMCAESVAANAEHPKLLLRGGASASLCGLVLRGGALSSSEARSTDDGSTSDDGGSDEDDIPPLCYDTDEDSDDEGNSSDSPSELPLPQPSPRPCDLRRTARAALRGASASMWGRSRSSRRHRKRWQARRAVSGPRDVSPPDAPASEAAVHPSLREGGFEATAAGANL